MLSCRWLGGCVGALAAAMIGVATAQAQQVLATVGQKSITAADVEKALQRTRFGEREISADDLRMYRKHVLNILVGDLLIHQFLDERKVSVDSAKVDEHIAEFRKQLAERKTSLEQFLKETGADLDTMRADIADMHRWIAYVESQMTDKAVMAYFEANKESFDKSQVRASHVLVKTTPEMTPTQLATARKKAEAVRAQVLAGAAFADLAKSHSDCPSKAVGGDMDFFPRRGIMVDEFAAAAFGLKVGEVSPVVESPFGFHVIVVTARTNGQPTALKDVEDEVRMWYAHDLRESVIARMKQKIPVRIALAGE